MAEYLLPPGMTTAAAAQAISRLLPIRNGRICQDERNYYDTFDRRLRGRGLVAVWAGGELSLRDREGGVVLARADVEKPARPLLAGDLPAGRLTDALRPLIGVRALLLLAEIRGRERPLDVLDPEGKTVVRVRVQQPAVGRRRLRARAQVRRVRGYDKAYRRVCRVIEERLGLEPAAALVDEALSSFGNEGRVAPELGEGLSAEMRSDTAAALLLQRLLTVSEANRDGTIRDLDSEFLHDLRVAVRRSRALQRELRGAFPRSDLERFRRDFRWLQQATGETRDLDVYVLDFEAMRALVPEVERAQLDPLLGVLRARRVRAHRRMVRALRSERTEKLFTDWRQLLERLESLPTDGRAQATEPIAQLASRRISKVYRRMVKMGEAVGPDSPATDYHELRKQGKELRYLLELLGARLYPEPAVKPMIKTLRALQDVLGRHQDREIQVSMLRSLGPEVAATSGGPEALMAMGMLVERLEEDQLAARGEFAERFAQFAAKPQRQLVRETFN